MKCFCELNIRCKVLIPSPFGNASILTTRPCSSRLGGNFAPHHRTMTSDSFSRSACAANIWHVCVLFCNLTTEIDCRNHLHAIDEHKDRCTQWLGGDLRCGAQVCGVGRAPGSGASVTPRQTPDELWGAVFESPLHISSLSWSEWRTCTAVQPWFLHTVGFWCNSRSL